MHHVRTTCTSCANAFVFITSNSCCFFSHTGVLLPPPPPGLIVHSSDSVSTYNNFFVCVAHRSMHMHMHLKDVTPASYHTFTRARLFVQRT